MNDLEQLAIQAALFARQQAYAPYSRFQVGAALVIASGEIFTGCNVENASYGLTICAERATVFAAIAAGHREFKLLALATAGGHAPCGACRQVLAEFAPDLTIIVLDVSSGGKTIHSLADLLPHTFAHNPKT